MLASPARAGTASPRPPDAVSTPRCASSPTRAAPSRRGFASAAHEVRTTSAASTARDLLEKYIEFNKCLIGKVSIFEMLYL